MNARRIVQTGALVAVIAPLALFSVCLAETKVITAEAGYTMGDGESPAFAEAQVLQKAKQTALEQAGTYVEAYTKTRNYDLTTEEVQTLTGGVVKVEVLEKTRRLVGDGLHFSTKIKATVTTDNMEELAQRIKGKNVAEEYRKLQDAYARLSREVETWKQLAAKTPAGPEREAAHDQIREREKDFARVQQREAALFQRLVSGQALVAEAYAEADQEKALKAPIDRLIESIKQDGLVVSIGKARASFSEDQQGFLKLTVPMALSISTRLNTMLSETAQSLGGEGVRLLRDEFMDKRSRLYCPDCAVQPGSMHLHSPSLGLPDEVPDSLTEVGPEDGELVRISNNPDLEDYFRTRVGSLKLEVELRHDDAVVMNHLIPMRCRVPRIMNRLIRPVADGRFNNRTIFMSIPPDEQLKMVMKAGIQPSWSGVLILHHPTHFNLEFLLPVDNAKHLERVTTQWVDEPGVLEVHVCDLTLKDR